MQTFLPHPDFAASARVLDYKRLGKQRVETKQILMALTGQIKGWRSHPATKMWTGHEQALARYGVAICREWRARGYRDTLLPYFEAVASDQPAPSWLGDSRIHASHRTFFVKTCRSTAGTGGANRLTFRTYGRRQVHERRHRQDHRHGEGSHQEEGHRSKLSHRRMESDRYVLLRRLPDTTTDHRKGTIRPAIWVPGMQASPSVENSCTYVKSMRQFPVLPLE
jgi:hypothetical protein